MASSRRTAPRQPTLPRLEVDGETHRRDCECPRCDAGFGPSESHRAAAARRWEERQAREAAEAALARKRERDRARALRVMVALEEEEKKTEAYLEAQRDLLTRLRQDPRLAALLASRRAGRSVDEALAEAERRFPPRASEPPGR